MATNRRGILERMNVWHALGLLVLLVAALLFVRRYGYAICVVPQGSMIPTIQLRDHVLVEKTGRIPRRGDVILFRFPSAVSKDLIERVIGLPGDRVVVKSDHVSVNGVALGGDALLDACSYDDLDAEQKKVVTYHCLWLEQTLDDHKWRVVLSPYGGGKDGEWTVADGTVFVLGDNRDFSYDSRAWGGVPLANIEGRALRIVQRGATIPWSPIP